MIVQHFTSLDSVPPEFGPSAVTLGKFDGVHLGHRFVIDTLTAAARDRDLTATVLTFDRNPLALIDPARSPESISSLSQKRELLAASGVDAVLELRFDEEFRAQSPADFVRRVIVDTLRASIVLVGPDTRFGANGAGHFDTLVELGAHHGFDVRQLEPLTDATRRISSTRIRALLAEGNVAEAAVLLGRAHSVRSVVVHGRKRGRELGYPTANLAPGLEGLIPADGVYAGYLTVTDGLEDHSVPSRPPYSGRRPLQGVRMPAAISIGNNPTFDGVPARQVEAYVLDEDIDLYDRVVTVEFVDRVRGMERFDSIDALIARMGLDTERVRKLTGQARYPLSAPDAIPLT